MHLSFEYSWTSIKRPPSGIGICGRLMEVKIDVNIIWDRSLGGRGRLIEVAV
jgi:hypothetical protein